MTRQRCPSEAALARGFSSRGIIYEWNGPQPPRQIAMGASFSLRVIADLFACFIMAAFLADSTECGRIKYNQIDHTIAFGLYHSSRQLRDVPASCFIHSSSHLISIYTQSLLLLHNLYTHARRQPARFTCRVRAHSSLPATAAGGSYWCAGVSFSSFSLSTSTARGRHALAMEMGCCRKVPSPRMKTATRATIT